MILEMVIFVGLNFSKKQKKEVCYKKIYMKDDTLNDDIQNLLKDLLLQQDIESERKLIQERGFTIDEKILKEFHLRKKEFFDFIKKNKDQLQKLDVTELGDVSGGINLLTLFNIAEEAINFIDAINQIVNIVNATLNGANIQELLVQTLQEQIAGAAQDQIWNTVHG